MVNTHEFATKLTRIKFTENGENVSVENGNRIVIFGFIIDHIDSVIKDTDQYVEFRSGDGATLYLSNIYQVNLASAREPFLCETVFLANEGISFTVVDDTAPETWEILVFHGSPI